MSKKNTGRETKLRARAFLDRWFGVALVGLVVLAACGGWLTYGAYAQQPTSVEQREVTVWTSSGEFTHWSTVVDDETNSSTVFPAGSTVEGRDVYFLSVMPQLDGEFGYAFDAEAGELTATIDRAFVIRSVGQTPDGRTEFWRETRQLGSETVTLHPGETAAVPFSVNVNEATASAQATRERLGDPGQTELSLNATVTLVGTAGGQQVDRTVEYTLPLSVNGGVYEVGAAGGTQEFTRTEQVVVETQPGPSSAVGGPVLLGLGLAGLLGLAAARYNGRLALTGAERVWLEYCDDRSDFDQWITTVQLPEEASSLPVAEAGSLGDLVDFAIDTDNAVLEAPEGGVFHVVHGGYRYTFVAPPSPTETSTEPAAPQESTASAKL